MFYCLSTKTTVIQLHDLLSCLQNLKNYQYALLDDLCNVQLKTLDEFSIRY
jgi:hypothetical protein